MISLSSHLLIYLCQPLTDLPVPATYWYPLPATYWYTLPYAYWYPLPVTYWYTCASPQAAVLMLNIPAFLDKLKLAKSNSFQEACCINVVKIYLVILCRWHLCRKYSCATQKEKLFVKSCVYSSTNLQDGKSLFVWRPKATV